MPESKRELPLVLIVTGSSLRAEELDRPLAYYLQRQVEEGLSVLAPEEAYEARIVSDLRWMHDDPLQRLPTISLGGPGVNLLAHRWLEELPLSLAVDNEYYLQMDPDLIDLRASIWGMNNASTQIAVSAFARRFLPRYLQRCVAQASEVTDSGNEEEEGPGLGLG